MDVGRARGRRGGARHLAAAVAGRQSSQGRRCLHWHFRFPCGHTRLPAEVRGTSLKNDEVPHYREHFLHQGRVARCSCPRMQEIGRFEMTFML